MYFYFVQFVFVLYVYSGSEAIIAGIKAKVLHIQMLKFQRK